MMIETILIGYSNSKKKDIINNDQPLSSSKAKTEKWDHIHSKLIGINTNEKIFVAGQSAEKRLFIHQINKETGQLFPKENDSIILPEYYNSLCSLTIGSKTYIVGQDDNNHLLTQEITAEGKLGLQKFYSHELKHRCVSLHSFRIGKKTYIAGQGLDEHFFVGKIGADANLEMHSDTKVRSFFIQEITSDTQLGKQTYYTDLWENYCENLCLLEINGKIFIARQDSKKNFFLQRITSDAQLGEVTYTETMEHYYKSLSSFNMGNTTYLTGQDSNKNFFIQKVTLNGHLDTLIHTKPWQSYYDNILTIGLKKAPLKEQLPQLEGTLIHYSNGDKKFFVPKDGIKPPKWNDDYSNLVGIHANGKDFILGQNTKKEVFIRRIEPDGQLVNTQDISWGGYYSNICSFEFKGLTYITEQFSAKTIYIEKVDSNGVLNGYDGYSFNNYYSKLFSFKLGEDVYIAGHNEEKAFFTQKIETRPETMFKIEANFNTDKEINQEPLENYYENLCFLSGENQTYMAGQSSTSVLFIRKIEAEGKLSEVTYEYPLNTYYQDLCFFKIENQTYLIGQQTGVWSYIGEVKTGGILELFINE